MRNTILIAAALVMATTVASSAANLAMKAPIAPASAWSWTGLYVGGNIGGGVATSQFGDPCFFCSSTTPTGGFFTGGGQIGYNYQFGSGLVGVEADVNGNSDFKSGVIGGDDNPSLRVRSNIDVSGTIRARGGVVVGNAMIYATGGLAWADIKQTGTEFCNGSSCQLSDTANFSGTKWGGVVGAGVEFALSPNLIVGGEFLHTVYTDTSANLIQADGSSSCGGSRTNCAITNHLTTDVARVRFNYKLN
jgi:opacity protein-like surface antigen